MGADRAPTQREHRRPRRSVHGGRAPQGLLSLALVAADAQALLINLRFAAPGERSFIDRQGRFAAPAPLGGGGSVAAVFGAAADLWEALLHDDRSFNITIGWTDDFGLGTIAAALPVSDGFNEIVLNNRLRHFGDATPLLHEEFGAPTEVVTDFGGGPIAAGRGLQALSPLDGFDLLTTALHEIGHVLGNPFDSPGGSGDFLIESGPFAGTALPCVRTGGLCGHLGIAAALMSPAGGLPLFDRALVGGADLLFVAADGRFGEIDLSSVGPQAVPAPPALALVLGVAMLWSACLGPVRRRRRCRPG